MTSFSKMKPSDKFLSKWLLADFDRGAFRKEYEFDQERKWRFDFAWPELKVAVEIDGFGYGHQAQQCLAEQNEKQNAAIEQGWKVLRYNSRQLGSHGSTAEAVKQVCRVLMDQGENFEDMSPCRGCGKIIACIPDGLPYCDECAAED